MTRQQEMLQLSRWLHKKRYGCVSSYGTDESAREAYDILKHQQDAFDYLGPIKDPWPSPGYIDTVGNTNGAGLE